MDIQLEPADGEALAITQGKKRHLSGWFFNHSPGEYPYMPLSSIATRSREWIF